MTNNPVLGQLFISLSAAPNPNLNVLPEGFTFRALLTGWVWVGAASTVILVEEEPGPKLNLNSPGPLLSWDLASTVIGPAAATAGLKLNLNPPESGLLFPPAADVFPDFFLWKN